MNICHATAPAETAGGLTTGVAFGGYHFHPRRLLAHWVTRLLLTLQVARERRQLAALDPRLLKDIGLSESTSFRETERSFFDLPGNRMH